MAFVIPAAVSAISAVTASTATYYATKYKNNKESSMSFDDDYYIGQVKYICKRAINDDYSFAEMDQRVLAAIIQSCSSDAQERIFDMVSDIHSEKRRRKSVTVNNKSDVSEITYKLQAAERKFEEASEKVMKKEVEKRTEIEQERKTAARMCDNYKTTFEKTLEMFKDQPRHYIAKLENNDEFLTMSKRKMLTKFHPDRCEDKVRGEVLFKFVTNFVN